MILPYCDNYVPIDGVNEKGSDIHTQENPAYATVERGIEMKSNSAYARVHISSSH